MKRSSSAVQWGAGLVILVVTLFFLRSWSARRNDGGSIHSTTAASGRPTLTVGFLPVTCHLTCPVTDFATKTSGQNRFESERFTDFPTVVEAIKSGRLDATFMIAPLAMKLREQGVPVRIVYLGHRDGSTVMVAKDSTAKSLRDLKGKRFGIPSRYSNQYLVIRKLMEDQGMAEGDLDFQELPPPEMPGALASHSIEGYFVGEPFAAKAQLDGTGRVLYMAKDIWPHFISCVLVVTDHIVKTNPEQVRDLVRGIGESGEWAQTHRLQAAKVAAPYFRQKEKLLDFVLTDPGRVSYTTLTPTDPEMQQIGDMALKVGILKKPISLKDMVDREFIPASLHAAEIKVTVRRPTAAPVIVAQAR